MKYCVKHIIEKKGKDISFLLKKLIILIPNKIKAIFNFIDFLDVRKETLINDYLPLCTKLKKLDKQRNQLSPRNNYTDKQEYDKIQEEIKEKFTPITNDIYKPITNKLFELGIWSGDETYSSIWNNNIDEISIFKENFSEDDLPKIFEYKYKYLSFRSETNSNFLCLGLLLQALDKLFESLFDFFKDTTDNEFESFESKTVKVDRIEDLSKLISQNRDENIKYEVPFSNLKNESKPAESPITQNIKQEIVMGDKIEANNITNSGQLNIGKNNEIDNESNNEELSKKSFNWQKWGIIIGSISTLIGIALMIYFNL